MSAATVPDSFKIDLAVWARRGNKHTHTYFHI